LRAAGEIDTAKNVIRNDGTCLRVIWFHQRADPPFEEINKMTRTLQVLAVSVALLLIPATSWSQGSAATQPINGLERAALLPSREMLALGENVADTACASCHGLDGVSTGPGTPNLAGQRTVYLYRVLQAYQASERSHDAMNQATGFLNEEALLAVSAYYASRTPARPPMPEEQPSEAADAGGGDPFASIRSDMKKCVKCHGDDGNASASGMPNLSAQAPEYFVAAMKAYAEGGRDHKMMAKLVANLDEGSLDKMGVFYAVQEPARTETTGDGDIDLGRAASEPCASCHGDDGNASGAAMPTLAGQDARYFVKAMKAYKRGKRHHEQMFDAVGELSEADVDNLAAFYASQEPVRRNVRTPLTTSEWVDRCERCHGIDGNSTDPRFPMLAGQDRTYLANALQTYIGTTRSNTTMHAMSDPLSAADVERIVEHYTTRQPKSVVYMQLPCEDLTDE
jgi:cytochrome c553